ncbi:MAG: sodium:calcium antiporter [Chloroflexi bacterium]|nr:sodium:calcium antiporter [Chloroflexota bacterium]
MALAFGVTVPWLVLRFQGAHPEPALTAGLAGLAILGSAFILSWAAEAFQKDVSQALALALLALIAVLPEYAVDMVFAWKAASDPTQASYAVANMTGANRLLIGIGWSAIVLVAWIRFRARKVTLEAGQSIELAILLLATLYAFFIPFKGGLSLVDTVVFGVLFALYAWAAARAPAHEPELVGPARTVGDLPSTPRRLATLMLFLFAAGTIFLSAEPFAEGLVETGLSFGIDEFLLVQWLAPLASEAPEFLVAILFAWRGDAAAGMRAMVSSKVNQWTLLIGTLALVYSIALGRPGTLEFDHRQVQELFLTSAQSLFAVVLIVGMALSWRGALALFVLFIGQLLSPWEGAHWWFAIAYLVCAIGLLLLDASRRSALLHLPGLARKAFAGAPHVAEPSPPAHG